MPSWAHYSKDGKVTVGRKAQQRRIKDPLNTFHSVKRFIGRTFAECKEDIANVGFEVVADEQGEATLVCPALNCNLCPEEVSAEILIKMIQDASDYLGEDITKAVITVPAYFNDEQKDSTKMAGEAAGLEKVKILREPQAAALAYGVNRDEDQTVMVFDLGGGTFDVAILEVGGGACEVLSTGGDAHLGGNDFDAAIMDWLIKEAQKKGVKVPRDNARAVETLLQLSRAAREDLSDNMETVIAIPTMAAPVLFTLTRNTLDFLLLELLRRMRLPMETCAFQAGVDLTKQGDQSNGRGKAAAAGRQGVKMRRSGRNIDEILMVGGAT
eukprot:CAMPEP_0198206402 /NCGR_PEP_ID=MMETSP1445-20131203/9938_1 /TAXON_ID=36898 /ORGANISM="Pyramimonas sp., Strain CCMP2087" /LENGTH=325 /DNA_ID=CAMNT_0043879081 /DNA_START=405 /DNA_END=1378 /DNA_ORIENTATION=-